MFDLNAVVSPGHAFSPTVDQINVRCTDGVHFTRSGGIFVGQRLAPELAALGQAHAGGVAGWRMAGPSATIDPVMVHEPALPVVRRATADDVTAMAAQMARTFFDDPGHVPHLPQRGPPRRRAAGLLPHPDEGRLPPVRRLLHSRGLCRLGHLGAGRASRPDGAERDPHHAARAALRRHQHAAPRCACWRWSRASTPASRTGTWPAWAPPWTSRARAWAAPSCARCSSTATPRASPATWSRPRSATCPSTGATGSRSSRRCRCPATGRPCGPCGGSRNRRS